jgi:hypothetical protein
MVVVEDSSEPVPDDDTMLITGCGCERQCAKQFPKEDILQFRYACLGLDFYCPLHENHLNLHLQGEEHV